MPRRVGRALLAATSLVSSVIACRQLVGIGDAPPMGPGSAALDGGQEGATGIAYGGPQCQACLDAHCRGQATACSASQACSQLEGCLGACDGGVTCRAQCTADHLIADPYAPALEACLSAGCAEPCALGCGSLAEAVGADAAASCAACLEQHACPQATACVTQSACLADLQCVLSGQAEDRNQACLAENGDAGAAAFNAVDEAVGASCVEPCAYGQQWYCVGHSMQHEQTNSATAMTLLLSDIAGAHLPAAGVTVNLCLEATGLPCDVVATESSDDAGRVQLPVSGPNLTTRYGPSGFVQLESPGIDELYYWVIPLSEPAVTIKVGVASQGELADIASLLGVQVDPGLGMVAFAVADCLTSPAPNVEVSVDGDSGTAFYFDSKSGGFTSSASATDVAGIGGVFNVQPGLRTITARPRSIGRPSTVFQGYVPEGGLTLFALNPNQ